MQWLTEVLKGITDFIPRISTLQPWEAGVRTTLGKHKKAIGPGWYVYWPTIQEIHYMEIQPQIVDLRVQSVWTSDGHDLAISGGVRYRISDAMKAFTNIQAVDAAIQNVSLGIIAEYVNARTMADCHDIVNLKGEILKGLRDDCQGWGVKVERVYITDIGRTRNIRLLHHNEAETE